MAELTVTDSRLNFAKTRVGKGTKDTGFPLTTNKDGDDGGTTP